MPLLKINKNTRSKLSLKGYDNNVLIKSEDLNPIIDKINSISPESTELKCDNLSIKSVTKQFVIDGYGNNTTLNFGITATNVVVLGGLVRNDTEVVITGVNTEYYIGGFSTDGQCVVNLPKNSKSSGFNALTGALAATSVFIAGGVDTFISGTITVKLYYIEFEDELPDV